MQEVPQYLQDIYKLAQWDLFIQGLIGNPGSITIIYKPGGVVVKMCKHSMVQLEDYRNFIIILTVNEN